MKHWKTYTLMMVLLLLGQSGSGQTLFFDVMKESSWIENKDLDDSTIKETKNIGLVKLNIPTDSLKTNRTIWVFSDSLTIRFYNAIEKQDSIIARYKYEIDRDNCLLKIVFTDSTTETYNVRIISTGFYVSLTRKKVQSK